MLDLDLPMKLSLEAVPGDSPKVALPCGPIVVAGDLGAADDELGSPGLSL